MAAARVHLLVHGGGRTATGAGVAGQMVETKSLSHTPDATRAIPGRRSRGRITGSAHFPNSICPSRLRRQGQKRTVGCRIADTYIWLRGNKGFAPRSLPRQRRAHVNGAPAPAFYIRSDTALIPRTILPAGSSCFHLGDFERRLFYHNLYGVVSLPALHFAGATQEQNPGRRSLPKAGHYAAFP